MLRRRAVLVAAAALFGGTTAAWSTADAPVAPEVVTDPAKAGPEYAIQGEYAGMAGSEKLGAQVIALGSGAFRAVFLPGGLPGNGWDGKKRVPVEGKMDGSAAVFGTEGAGWTGRIAEGSLTGTTETGTKFRLEKVARQSPTLGLKPPAGAVALFDGTSVDAWVNGKKTEDGLLQPGSRTKQSFTDFTMHLEFRTPFKPDARGQERGNSGVYILGRYEVQILDSFGLEGKANECGALYREKAPDVNMCYPPLIWQTYDIDFQDARFDAAGQKLKNALITLRHNGVVVQKAYELTDATGGGKRVGEKPGSAPISLQNHRNPVLFRNVWIVPHGG